jgi:hypothetical protein
MRNSVTGTEFPLHSTSDTLATPRPEECLKAEDLPAATDQSGAAARPPHN